MMRYSSLIILSVLMLFAVSYAAGEDFFVELRGPQGGQVVAGGENAEVRTMINSEIVITLAANPTTGFQWQLRFPLEERIIKLVRKEYIPPQTARVGAGGQEVWIFHTAGAGETDITLGYVRPWEQDKPPVRKRTIRVTVMP